MSRFFKKLIFIPIILFAVEVGLRVLGYTPYAPPSPGKVRFLEIDDVVGWKHIPGDYQFPVNTWGDTMNLSINPRGERITKPAPLEGNPEELLLVGGSFTMGFGLDDEQTFAWKLQEKFPGIDIRNLGVGAYGTYQSLLVLEEQFKRKKKPKVVIHGLIGHHRLRNIAQPDWLQAIAMAGKQSDANFQVPFVTLGENEEVLPGEPLRLLQVPFSNQLATSFMVQRTINNFSGSQRIGQADRVLERLLIEMRKLCEQHNVQFYVAILYCQEPYTSKLNAFLDEANMSYIDCNVPLNAENTFRDDRHPKEVVQDEWTRRISDRLIKDGVVQDASVTEIDF